jgi:hypothetical protein
MTKLEEDGNNGSLHPRLGMDKTASPVTKIVKDAAYLDPKSVEKVRDFLHLMGNTVSAMKLFPSDHATIKTFIQDLSRKILDYLDTHGKLELSVEEFSFVCAGKTVYTDEMTIKSLPFFFFKDGMQKLFFYQGLDAGEILEFLNVIKKEAKKPGGEADIITALWEKDFAHIQYYAPDEFLENRILQECRFSRHGSPASVTGAAPDAAEFSSKAIEIKVDTAKFSSGKIELSEEDRRVVQTRSSLTELGAEEQPRIALEKVADSKGALTAGRGSGTASEHSRQSVGVQGPAEEIEEGSPQQSSPPSIEKTVAKEIGETWLSPAATMDFSMTEPEIANLETLVSSSRKISPDEEFLNLMAEILNLEKDPRNFNASLDILMQYQLEQLLQGNFSFSILLIHRLRELKALLTAGEAGKASQIDAFLKRVGSGKTLEAIQLLLGQGQTVDWDRLVQFFSLLGPAALPIAADIYESVPDVDSRQKLLDFMKSVALQDLGHLVSLAADERPLLSKAIIGILAKDGGKKAIPHFAVFLGFKDKHIKLEAIRALGHVSDEMSNKILLGFLNDPDEGLRIQAALSLNPVGERSRIQQVIGEARSRAFQTKGLKEKEAIFNFLGRTRTPEAFDFLRTLVLRKHLWTTARVREMMLAAVTGLESMGTDDAEQALEKGAGGRPREVREACSRALARLARSKQDSDRSE